MGLEWTKATETAAATPVRRRSGAAPGAVHSGIIDEQLRAALKKWRLEAARAQAVPAYVILHDSTVDAICRQHPKSMIDLLEIPGIGERKAERFGEEILALLNG